MLLQEAVWSDQLGWALKQGKKRSGGNHRSTGSCRTAPETASAFLQQMSHPGLKCHKPYPVFLPMGTKPPLIRYKNLIV